MSALRTTLWFSKSASPGFTATKPASASSTAVSGELTSFLLLMMMTTTTHELIVN